MSSYDEQARINVIMAGGARTPDQQNIWQAAWDGDQDAVKQFLADGQDINEYGYDSYKHGIILTKGEYVSEFAKTEGVSAGTPLMFACTVGDVEMVELLLKSGAEPGLRLADGATPKQIAKTNGFKHVTLVFDEQTRKFDTNSPYYTPIKEQSQAISQQEKAALKALTAHNVGGIAVSEEDIRPIFNSLLAHPDDQSLSVDVVRRVYESWDNFGAEESTEDIDELFSHSMLDDDQISFEEFAILYLRFVRR